jgi:hypothetical protein
MKRDYGLDTDFIDFYINNTKFHIYESTISDKKAINFISEFSVQNKTFYDIHYFTSDSLKVYINKDYGVFYIENGFNNNKYLIQ